MLLEKCNYRDSEPCHHYQHQWTKLENAYSYAPFTHLQAKCIPETVRLLGHGGATPQQNHVRKKPGAALYRLPLPPGVCKGV